ncbi:hypothetical protein E5F90_15955 [Acinetobacter baumannii]|nr:hypothetical protein [Acinetobacter baumannii]MDB0306822.1 hypothetical protein [Acinetobacter baumannii]THD94492.1 hypothetical protein E5F90_15955 [Acinetobacter baumannii]
MRVSHRQLIILNTPISKEVGVFFYSKNSINKELFKYRTTNHFWMLTRFYGYNEEVFYFWCPREN